MSASPIPSRLNVLRTRVEELTEREQELLAALQETRAGLMQSRAELEQTERAGERARARGNGLPQETWRRTVRELGTFTVSELAAELGCSKATATKHLNAMLTIVPPMVQAAGRVLGKPVFEYVRPRDEGKAFQAQQRHLAPAQDIERSQPIAGTGSSGSSMIADKVVRAAVREAEARGWKLHKKGDGHFLLTKGGRRAFVTGTPSNSGDSADIIRRMTREP